jgi:Tfp pilus assembly protein FimV
MNYIAVLLLLCSQVVWAESTRIEVYPVSQAYYDVYPGDTLGEIATELLPDTPNLRQRLRREIIELNPDAFIDGDPSRLRANARLWLPNSPEQATAGTDSSARTVENYSWGSISRPK